MRRRGLLHIIFLATATIGLGPGVESMLVPFARKDFSAGCACTYGRAGLPEQILFANDPGSSGYLRIGAKPVELSLERSDLVHARKAGDHYRLSYTGAECRVTYDAERTSSCPEGSADCTSMSSRGRLTVTKGKKKEVVDVVGNCESCD